MAKPDESPKKPADHSTGNADQDGNEDSTRVFARHDEFGERTGDQAEKNPRENAHGCDVVGIAKTTESTSS